MPSYRHMEVHTVTKGQAHRYKPEHTGVQSDIKSQVQRVCANT